MVERPTHAETEMALKMFQKGLTQDASSDYVVAESAELDWCPCCGINLRLYDNEGRQFAKWILDEDTATHLRNDLSRQLFQRERFMPTPEAEADLQRKLEVHITAQPSSLSHRGKSDG